MCIRDSQKAMYFANLGATKTIWKGDGTIGLNVQDLFNTRAVSYTHLDVYKRQTC